MCSVPPRHLWRKDSGDAGCLSVTFYLQQWSLLVGLRCFDDGAVRGVSGHG